MMPTLVPRVAKLPPGSIAADLRPAPGPVLPPDSVVCWKWHPRMPYRSIFSAETVNVLRRMVARHYPHPHRFICVTDDPAGIDAGIEIVPIWTEYAHLVSPHGGQNPSCYRRLRAFAPEAADYFGARFVSLDLDCVIVGDLTPLWHRPEAFVIWGDTAPKCRYNGSMFLLTAGARPQVWTDFDPRVSPSLAKAAGHFGSDQAWISFRLGAGEARWSAVDGVYSYRNEILPRGNVLPKNARIVMFHGKLDPWDRTLQRVGWIREAYC